MATSERCYKTRLCVAGLKNIRPMLWRISILGRCCLRARAIGLRRLIGRAGARVTGPEMLAHERFVLTGSDEPDDVRHFRLRYRLGLAPAGEAENLEEAKRMIEAGVGIGFLPTVLIERSTRQDTLWPILPQAMLPNYYLYLITKPETQQTLPTQLFLHEIRRRLSARGTPV